MSLSIAATDRALTALVRLLARGVPPNQYLREFIMNCIDALLRGGVSDHKPPGIIRVARDKQYPNKMVITNSVPGDPLTRFIVKEHLMSLANSGNDLDLNHGIGAKIAYVANYGAILYRCRAQMIQFIIWINPETEVLELKSEEVLWFDDDDDVGSLKTEVFVPCDEEDFTFADSEVEVVLLGSDEQEDTWVKACDLLSGKGNSCGHAAGYLIADYLRHKWWEIPSNIQVDVHTYDKEKKENQIRSISFLKDFKEKRETSGTVLHPDGSTIEWYTVPFQGKGKSKSSHDLAGTPGCIHQNEVFIPPGLSEPARSKLMQQAGVWVRSKNVQILVRLPDDGWDQSADRSDVVDSNAVKFSTKLPDYLEYFRGHFPPDLKAWMDKYTRDTTDDYKKAAKAIMARAASSAAAAKEVTTVDGKDEGLGHPQSGDDSNTEEPADAPEEEPETGEKEETPKKPRKRRKRKPQTGNDAADNPEVPEFRLVNAGEEESVISWDFAAYAINVNLDNPVFHYHKNRVSEGYSYPEKIVDNALALRYYLNVVTYYASLIHSYPNLSSDLLEEKLKDDKLDAIAINYSLSKLRADIEREICKQKDEEEN